MNFHQVFYEWFACVCVRVYVCAYVCMCTCTCMCIYFFVFVNRRKSKPEVLEVSLCSKFLTDEDRQFLSGHPDCIAIGRKLDEAIDSVKMCIKTHSELMAITCNTVRKAKQEMDTMKQCICDKALENEEVQGIFDGSVSMESFLSTNSGDES